jgi:molybdopterin-binding protein
MLSARNRIKGTVISVNVDGIMAEVVVQAGAFELVSVITRTSAEGLKLKAGDQVEVVIKATEVMIAKD